MFESRVGQFIINLINIYGNKEWPSVCLQWVYSYSLSLIFNNNLYPILNDKFKSSRIFITPVSQQTTIFREWKMSVLRESHFEYFLHLYW